jgi:hypothetical protein
MQLTVGLRISWGNPFKDKNFPVNFKLLWDFHEVKLTVSFKLEVSPY